MTHPRSTWITAAMVALMLSIWPPFDNAAQVEKIVGVELSAPVIAATPPLDSVIAVKQAETDASVDRFNDAMKETKTKIKQIRTADTRMSASRARKTNRATDTSYRYDIRVYAGTDTVVAADSIRTSGLTKFLLKNKLGFITIPKLKFR